MVMPISAGPRPIHLTDSRLQERGSEWEKTTAPADAEASAAPENESCLSRPSGSARKASPRKGSRLSGEHMRRQIAEAVLAERALTNTVSTTSPWKGSSPSDLHSTPRCVSTVQLSLLLLRTLELLVQNIDGLCHFPQDSTHASNLRLFLWLQVQVGG